MHRRVHRRHTHSHAALPHLFVIAALLVILLAIALTALHVEHSADKVLPPSVVAPMPPTIHPGARAPASSSILLGTVHSIDKDFFTIAIPTPPATTTVLTIKIATSTKFYLRDGETRTLVQEEQDIFASDQGSTMSHSGVATRYTVTSATFADIRVGQRITVHIATSTSAAFGYPHASEVDIVLPRK